MIASLALLAWLAPAPSPSPTPARDPTLSALVGCWSAVGDARGTPSRGTARAAWAGDQGYFAIELHPDTLAGAMPLATMVAVVGPDALIAFWTTARDGLALAGKGRLANGALDLDSGFPDPVLRSRIEREGKDWRWTATDASARPLATYRPPSRARADGP